jgi:cytochrome c2
LHAFTSQFFKSGEKGLQWTEQQKELLLDSKVSAVITNIIELAGSENEDAAKLIAYFQGNQDRMDYKCYKTIGCGLIGSGAIESATAP